MSCDPDVEAVARAIYESRARLNLSTRKWESLSQIIRDEWMEDARAAMSADPRVKALEEALDPEKTKYAYSGEFKFNLVIMNSHGEEETVTAYVPWPTIKEIMAAILSRSRGGDK